MRFNEEVEMWIGTGESNFYLTAITINNQSRRPVCRTVVNGYLQQIRLSVNHRPLNFLLCC